MKAKEFIHDVEFDEAKPTNAYCVSTPPEDMSASWKNSCKARALVPRSSINNLAYNLGDKGHKRKKGDSIRTKIAGKKIKGKHYGGPLPKWS